MDVKRILTVLLCCISMSLFSQDIRIASYNMMRLGNGSKDYAALASVVGKYDVVGALEVMKEKGMKDVGAHLSSSWRYCISPSSVGEKSYREYYGFFYNSDTVEVVKDLGFYPDKGFVRPPYCVRFKEKTTGFEFNYVIVHIVFGDNVSDRIAEINNLGKVYSYFETATGSKEETIIAGDFNEDNLKQFDEIIALGVEEISTVKKTTFGKTDLANDYDHMFISSRLKKMIIEADVDYWTSDWTTRKTVSDHFPIYCVLSVLKE